MRQLPLLLLLRSIRLARRYGGLGAIVAAMNWLEGDL